MVASFMQLWRNAG